MVKKSLMLWFWWFKWVGGSWTSFLSLFIMKRYVGKVSLTWCYKFKLGTNIILYYFVLFIGKSTKNQKWKIYYLWSMVGQGLNLSILKIQKTHNLNFGFEITFFSKSFILKSKNFQCSGFNVIYDRIYFLYLIS